MKLTKQTVILCPLCKSNNFKTLFSSTLQKIDFDPKIIRADLKNTLDNYHKHSTIVQCRKCSLTFTNPMEDFSQLFEGYQEVEDLTYLETEKFRKILVMQHLSNIEQFKKQGNILDIGCFAGFFLELAKKRGWNTYGIEPSIWACKQAKKRQVKIIGSDIEKIKLRNEFYDVITFWDVIEHLPNPRSIIQKCYKATSQNGLIALGTPNIESLIAKLLKSNNPYLVRMHLVFYSPRTLKMLLEEVGYKTIKTYNYGRTFPVSYVIDRLKTNNALYKYLKKSINAIPSIANFPITVNIGDSFGIIARK